ncbi:MAG: hypothetical protein WKF67_03015, partial [Rubrobacteraceae bacterium]
HDRESLPGVRSRQAYNRPVRKEHPDDASTRRPLLVRPSTGLSPTGEDHYAWGEPTRSENMSRCPSFRSMALP